MTNTEAGKPGKWPLFFSWFPGFLIPFSRLATVTLVTLEMTAPIPILMDVDTGVDDALAILLATLHPDLDLVGITTVSGNCHGEQAALNTRCLLEQFTPAPAFPLRVGALEALDGRVPSPADQVHGADGLGGVSERFWAGRESDLDRVLEQRDGVGFLLEMARTHAGRLTIVATGPLTNLALAARADAVALRSVGEILAMGGAVESSGNVTEFAEFNVHCDPEALGVLLDEEIPITLFPLDVTREVVLLRSALTSSSSLEPARLSLLRDMTDRYMRFHKKRDQVDGCYVHDALPVAALVDRSLFAFRSGRIIVDRSRTPQRGRTRWSAPDEGGATVDVALEVDAERFFEVFWSALGRSDLQCRYGA